MNMHVPQSKQTEVELRELALVPTQILSPAYNSPIINIVQDTLVGTYLFTRNDNYLTRQQVYDLLGYLDNFNGDIPEPDIRENTPFEELPTGFPQYKYNTDDGVLTEDLWLGNSLFETIIPDINLKRKNKSYGDSESKHDEVRIVNGKIKHGTIDKSILNSGQGILHIIYNELGDSEAELFLNNVQILITKWMLMSGFSVGISDIIADDTTSKKMKKTIKKYKDKVLNTISNVHKGIMKNETGQSDNVEFEIQVMKNLNETLNQAGKLGNKTLDSTNRLMNMVMSGSKGSTLNIGQMIACVGQQSVDGKRVPYGFNNRTLPHFHKYDDGPISRGFVNSSFLQGLKPDEFFFHAMGGREGIIDTAVKTSETGYIQRKLVKALENIKVNYDYTVRNTQGHIIQFLYGDDGLKGECVEKQSIPTLNMDMETIEEKYHIDSGFDWSHWVLNEEEEGEEDDSLDDKLTQYYQQILADRTFIIENVMKLSTDNDFYYAVNFRRLIVNTQQKFVNKHSKTKTDLTPKYVLKTLDKLEEVFMINNNKTNRIALALARAYLCPKDLICKFGFNKFALDYIYDQIVKVKFTKLIEPGEAVGIIAAQSIGEPSTQMSNRKNEKITIIAGDFDKKQIDHVYCGEIGEFIDNLMTKHPENTYDTGFEDSYETLLDNDEFKYYIIGVDEQEKCKWNRISHVSRHPANGNLVTAYTKSGRKITTTLTHSHLARTVDKVVPVKAGDLKLGMRIPILKNIEFDRPTIDFEKVGEQQVELNAQFGWFIGAYLAEGCLCGNQIKITSIQKHYQEQTCKIAELFGKTARVREYKGAFGPGTDTFFSHKPLAEFLENTCGKGSFNKHLPSFTFATSKEFQAALIRGYFDGDGNVNCDKNHKEIRMCSRSEQLMKDIALLLNYFGIFAYMNVETKQNKPFYLLNISRKYADPFLNKIGTSNDKHRKGFEGIIAYINRPNAHDVAENIDKIPNLGDCIAICGKKLELPGQSRNYGRWRKKESIGRNTLGKYISIFTEALEDKPDVDINYELSVLVQAFESDVVWDEIVKLDILDDPKEYVYDFTVPGNQTFMNDYGIIVHNTLNTFHFAGISSKSNVTRGIPRFKEILNLTSNPKAPVMTVHLKDDYAYNKDRAIQVSNELGIVKLKDIITETSIFYDPDSAESFIDNLSEHDTAIMKLHKKFRGIISVGADEGTRANPWVLRLKLDKRQMLERNITMAKVYHAINNRFNKGKDDIECIYSDDNSSNLILRLQIKEDKDDHTDANDMIQLLQSWEKKLMRDTIISGIQNVTNATPSKNINTYIKQGDDYVKSDRWVIDTDGANLLDIMTHPAVDTTKTISNKIDEIYNMFGIEAARQAILNEIVDVFGFNGTYINRRHIQLLADTMTSRGWLMQIDRHGINKSERGPLAKCSFEETADILSKTAIFGELDNILGVSANIMVGQEIPMGTGATTALFDEQKFVEEYSKLPKDRDNINEIEVKENDEYLEEYCDFGEMDLGLGDIDDTI
jgi:DNA-directed RNA polymerase beta' subunit